MIVSLSAEKIADAVAVWKWLDSVKPEQGV